MSRAEQKNYLLGISAGIVLGTGLLQALIVAPYVNRKFLILQLQIDDHSVKIEKNIEAINKNINKVREEVSDNNNIVFSRENDE